ncbi:Lipase (class 3) [Geosmithia morbida]|uniref:Lipase (Class 3) n=1 Tax=Geosmithia morbida TaxID=1094350 RepID=A0A9P4YUI1_9HYPO|nr:Lipase (class 3) [Geosmithia morbida]KAF4121931.1 Lipase (class 3) [Geosmithia morbida]
MGFFTRSNKAKEPTKKLKSASLTEPPNVFVPVSQPVYSQQVNASTPQLSGGRGKHVNKKKKKKKKEQKQQPPVQAQLQLHQPPPQQQQQQQQQNQGHHMCGPVVVNQHYYLGGQPPQNHSSQPLPLLPPRHPYAATVGFSSSVGNLAQNLKVVPSCADGLTAWYDYSADLVTSTVNACDDISRRLNRVLTLIDGEHLAGDEVDLFTCRTQVPESSSSDSRRTDGKKSSKDRDRSKNRNKDKALSASHDVFDKVNAYANSRLPKDLPPFAVQTATWQLLCLAARYSLSVYDRPSGAERETHVSSDWLTGTKAMCIKSVPMDDMETIVFAVRGTASFMDWAVNLRVEPKPPTGFLDDPGNLCHAGFLSVARHMIRPVALRLRQLLREDPSRSRCSLLITGHSAGGAVASLLYSHMLAQAAESQSELSLLTGRFKRVHCVTFGTPPVSVMPLAGPECPQLRTNSLFLSFVNEGDPVTRADKGYVKSLLELLGSPSPDAKHSSKTRRKKSSNPVPSAAKPVWPVPPCTLSNAGTIVVMRGHHHHRRPSGHRMATLNHRLEQGVAAHVCREDQLRGVIWSEPMAHLMQLYAGRIESLAVQAVTGKYD